MYRHNFHTHTSFCDGSSAPREYVLSAIKSGLKSLGFSGHAPVPFENGFAISGHDSLLEYCEEINKLKFEFRNEINIFLALEADYIPGVSEDFCALKSNYGLDYIIGSVHLVTSDKGSRWFIDGPNREVWKKGLETDFGGNIRKAVTAYYRQIIEMVETQKPDVIGHLDKIKMHNRNEYFMEDERWYTDLISKTLEAIKASGCIVEVNTRGLYKKRSEDLFPGRKVMAEMNQMNIPVCINTDAHKPTDIALLLDEAADAVKHAGYGEAYIFDDSGWKGSPLN